MKMAARFVLMSNKIFLTTLLSLSCIMLPNLAVARNCEGLENHPNGKASNFDINKHLDKFSRIRSITEGQVPYTRKIFRAAIMADSFYSYKTYDLKHSSIYKSSPDFGNWFYGAAARELGFSLEETLKAGAYVQQIQNFTNTQHSNYDDVGAFATGILASHLKTGGHGDNQDDPSMIRGGYAYAKNIYSKDQDSEKHSNSCDSQSIEDFFLEFDYNLINNTGGSGIAIGWSGGSISFGFPRGIVIIKDLDPLPQQKNTQ